MKQIKRSPLLLAAGLAFCLASSHALAQRASAPEAIAALNKEFEEAHVKGDAKALANQYSRDAQILWTFVDIARGREAIEAAWIKAVGSGGMKGKVKTLEVQEMGDWAYETGIYTCTDPQGKLVEDSKYLVVWKLEDGKWKLHRDISSPNPSRQSEERTAAESQSLTLSSELKAMDWQLGTWAADTDDPKGKWRVTFTPGLGGKAIEIFGSWSDGQKVTYTMKGLRYHDKKRRAIVSVFTDSDGNQWDQIGTLSEGRTEFRDTSADEKGVLTTSIGVDQRIDPSTYHQISITVGPNGEIQKKPAWVHKKVK